jgi:hypothetical protein
LVCKSSHRVKVSLLFSLFVVWFFVLYLPTPKALEITTFEELLSPGDESYSSESHNSDTSDEDDDGGRDKDGENADDDGRQAFSQRRSQRRHSTRTILEDDTEATDDDERESDVDSIDRRTTGNGDEEDLIPLLESSAGCGLLMSRMMAHLEGANFKSSNAAEEIKICMDELRVRVKLLWVVCVMISQLCNKYYVLYICFCSYFIYYYRFYTGEPFSGISHEEPHRLHIVMERNISLRSRIRCGPIYCFCPHHPASAPRHPAIPTYLHLNMSP